MEELPVQWDVTHKTEFTYDANGDITLITDYEWNNIFREWTNQSVTKYTYDKDINGNDTLIVEYYLDLVLPIPDWINKVKSTYTYDANGNITLHIDYYWDSNTSEWFIAVKYEYVYDANENMALQIVYYWDSNTSQWVASNKKTYYYSEHNITHINNIPEKHISVYPNPAIEYILFDLANSSSSATVELYDLQGKKVLEQKLTENRQVAVSNLPKGLYMYKLNNRGTIYTGKLIIE